MMITTTQKMIHTEKRIKPLIKYYKYQAHANFAKYVEESM